MKTDVTRAARAPEPISKRDEPASLTLWSAGLLLGGAAMFASAKYLEFTFQRDQAVWRYDHANNAPYRAWCRIEFRPERGDPAIILQTHLGTKGSFRALRGNDGQFEILGVSAGSGSAAAALADGLADGLKQSLDEAGLGTSFKIVARAKTPEKQWMGDDAPELENKKP